MADIYCVCGAKAPVVKIDMSEPDPEIREHYMGREVVKCETCYTITLVTGTLKTAVEDAEKMGGNLYLK